MKRIPFPQNDRDFRIEFHKVREGPSGFMCYYKNAATYRIDPLDAWRTLGVAKFTDTGKSLKAWCLEIAEANAPVLSSQDTAEQVQSVENTFFDHTVEEEPNDNTKMVV